MDYSLMQHNYLPHSNLHTSDGGDATMESVIMEPTNTLSTNIIINPTFKSANIYKSPITRFPAGVIVLNNQSMW